MIVLGIDCSTRQTNLGVSSDGDILAETGLELGRSQAAQLPLLAEEVLIKAQIGFADIDLLAAANGPGYYTGIRTGVAYTAALAEALGIKTVPLSTLELFVFDLKGRGIPLAPVIKAKCGYVYAALYAESANALTAIMPPSFISAAEFAGVLAGYPEALLVGSDAGGYPELLNLPNLKLARNSGRGGQAALMGRLMHANAISPALLRGNYLRKPDIGMSRELPVQI